MSGRSIEEINKDARLFSSCSSLSELQLRLNINTNELKLHSLHPKYYSFTICKPGGGFREIETPVSILKEIQRKLSYYLQAWYYEHQTTSSYGYIICPKKKKSLKNIVGNARLHLGNPYMMQMDFDDFFHHIRIRDVYGIFRSTAFNFSEETSCTLAKVCTYNGRLPMGAPTSPVLSNIYVIELDKKIEKWAAIKSVIFSRFVDDLTFSSKERPFTENDYNEILDITNYFHLQLNPKKVKLLGPFDSKTVTGLTLNETIDIPSEFYKSLDNDLIRLKSVFETTILTGCLDDNPLLKKIKQEIQGEINFIGMVEGFNSPQFKEYNNKYHRSIQVT